MIRRVAIAAAAGTVALCGRTGNSVAAAAIYFAVNHT